MQWIDPVTAIYCGLVGGFIGGAFTSFCQYLNYKSNMQMMRNYWSDDIYRLKASCTLAHSRLDDIRDLSTVSVNNPVVKPSEHRRNKGFYASHQIKQGD